MNIKKGMCGVASTLLLIGASLTAQAAPIYDITTIGTWNVPGGVTELGTINTPNLTASGSTISWGNGTADRTSSYTYTGLTNELIDFETDGFGFGLFSHTNRPITIPSPGGTFGFQVEFSVDVDIINNSTGLEEFSDTFTYLFEHDETLNTGNGCCADFVSIPNGNAVITLDGQDYFLQIAGFFDSNGDFTSEFETDEGTTQNGSLVGDFVEVGEPATLALFGLSLLSLGALRRRNKA
jgi:hypothetical protein